MPDPQNVTPIHRGRPQGIGQPTKSGGFSFLTLALGLIGGATAYHFVSKALSKDEKPAPSDRLRAFAASQGIGPMPMVSPMLMPAPRGTLIAVGGPYGGAAAAAPEPEYDYQDEE